MPDHPKARTTRLLVEELDGELMIYDQDADTAHVLSDDVARVWQRCDGTADAARIASDVSLDPSTVTRALDELEACGLMSRTSGAGEAEYSRRDAVKKVAKVGAAAAAVPLIYSVAVPSAAMAASACGGTCGTIGGTVDDANAHCVEAYADCVAGATCVGLSLNILGILLSTGTCQNNP